MEEFVSGGVRCRGWFYRPDTAPPYPCVVMAHGFGAAPDGPLGGLARRLADAGIAAFAFDPRRFGASEGTPRLVLDLRLRLEDWDAAIAHICARGDVDPGRIGLWGSSLTGGEVLAVAARRDDIAAVVAQAPYSDGFVLMRALGLVHLLKSIPPVVLDLLRAATGRPPFLIEGLGPPGARAVINVRVPDMYEEVVVQAPRSWRNQIAARSLIGLYRFRPIREAHRIQCPLLVVLTYKDHLSPRTLVMRRARRLPYVELAMFPVQHFELYAGDAFDDAARTEIEFFTHRFGVHQGLEGRGDLVPFETDP